jgi:hypothetical protein
MAKFGEVLAANTSIPSAIERKFAFLPKLSKPMADLAMRVPPGPDLPDMVVKVLEPPPPNKEGQPLAGFLNSAPITGPKLPAMPGGTETEAKLPLSPRNPGAGRGQVEYAALPNGRELLSPRNPGAARGTFSYGD